MYKYIIRLFSTNTAYRLFLFNLRILERIPFSRFFRRLHHPTKPRLARNVLGIDFNGPVGLGAGMDREGQYYNSFSDFGFSFVMIGPADVSGIRKSIEILKVKKPRTVIAACLSKDHLSSFSLAYDFVDMFILDAADEDLLSVTADILDARLAYDEQKPVLVRIGHEFSKASLESILDFCLVNGVDGFLVASTEYVRKVNEFCSGRVPIIGYGKIRTPEAAQEMLDAGASLLAITTGLVLDGPSLITKILKYLDKNESQKAGNQA